MKKLFRKLSAVICAVLALTLMCGSTVLADGRDTSLFDFGQTVLTIPQGGSAKISLYSRFDYTYYMTGQTSKKTYLDADYKSGSSNVTFHVGADEKIGTVTFYFYAVDHDGTYDSVQVRVVSPTSAQAAGQKVTTTTPATTASAVAVPFTDGTTGTETLQSNSKVVLISDAAGTPVGAFSLTGTSGQLVSMQTGAVVNNGGFNWLSITTAIGNGTMTVNLAAADKAALMTRGIGGLYLNGQYVAWQ